MRVIKYESEEEAQEITAEQTNQGYILIEVQNITGGNFLAFDDRPNPQPTVLKQKIQDLQDTVDILLLNRRGYCERTLCSEITTANCQ
jgi:hypothetical protein